jgi:hypothetical protein
MDLEKHKIEYSGKLGMIKRKKDLSVLDINKRCLYWQLI